MSDVVDSDVTIELKVKGRSETQSGMPNNVKGLLLNTCELNDVYYVKVWF